jgi:hypothetical protein
MEGILAKGGDPGLRALESLIGHRVVPLCLVVRHLAVVSPRSNDYRPVGCGQRCEQARQFEYGMPQLRCPGHDGVSPGARASVVADFKEQCEEEGEVHRAS